jgi:CRISPR-associated endoribonuclease Cas6
MLTSLVLTLQTDTEITFPYHLGHASRAAFLHLISHTDPDLAARLGAPHTPPPFTCSNLWGVRRIGHGLLVRADKPAFLRYTGLTAEVSRHLQRLATDPPPAIGLDGVALRVTQATLDPVSHPWANQVSYKELAETYLTTGDPPSNTDAWRQVELEFASPTTFRAGRKTLPLPLPPLVYNGLAEKWNRFTPLLIAEDVSRFTEECVVISRHSVSTRVIAAANKPFQIGFVGRCRYVTLNRNPYWQNVIQLLSDFAFYAGIGCQTTIGMGQARRNNERQELDAQSRGADAIAPDYRGGSQECGEL